MKQTTVRERERVDNHDFVSIVVRVSCVANQTRDTKFLSVLSLMFSFFT